ncbi:MAG: hypothetical protein M1813_002799 [Trichoglossum hirsutum]|nr:MAG: hypothetical protein M1813_002799 [Trichoglossum hirsutum]
MNTALLWKDTTTYLAISDECSIDDEEFENLIQLALSGCDYSQVASLEDISSCDYLQIEAVSPLESQEDSPPYEPDPLISTCDALQYPTDQEPMYLLTKEDCANDESTADKLSALEREVDELKYYVDSLRDSLSSWTDVINKIVGNFVEERWMNLEQGDEEAIYR